MFILSFGNIVQTSFKVSIDRFQALADRLELGINVLSLMGELTRKVSDQEPSVLEAFNQGQSIEDFQAVITECFFRKVRMESTCTEEVLKIKEEAFLEEFVDCWNAMCIVDDQAKEVFRHIANTLKTSTDEQAHVYEICSDTNPLHLGCLGDVMRECGLNPAFICTTFENKCTKEVLLLDMIKTLRADDFTETITLILGKNDKITNPDLLEMIKERDDGVMKAVSLAGGVVERLEGNRVSVPYLEALIASRHARHKSDSLTFAFNAERTQSPTAEPMLELKRSPSPT